MAPTTKSRVKTLIEVFKDAGQQYGKDFVSRMAAAISYRTVFALAPMIVIAISIAGFVLGGDEQARDALVRRVPDVAGPQMGEFMEDFVETALEGAGTVALVGALALIWTASTLFMELQKDLNEIFEIPPPEEKKFLAGILQRLVGVLWVVAIGLALIALFGANAATQAAGNAVSDWINLPEGVVGVLGLLVTFGFMILMFALVFQTMTRGALPWRPVWVGSVFTAVAFSLAGYATGFYFRTFDEPSAVGFSGLIIVLLFLAFLLSSVFLFGAQVTQSYRKLVWEKEDTHLLFDSSREVDRELEPEPSKLVVTTTAIATFVIGLILGRRK